MQCYKGFNGNERKMLELNNVYHYNWKCGKMFKEHLEKCMIGKMKTYILYVYSLSKLRKC